ncbi:MAG: Hpt domain-containing protein [Undibacterium sp.]|nr:Hpt domain-containing protein [Undibacterium sp.]
MTSSFSNFSESPQDQFDIGPLSWVMGEVREAITNAAKLLSDAVGQDAETQATTLLHAKSYLHQAHGALQIVDIDGVSIVTETIEDIIERLQSGQLEINRSHIDVISDAFHAVLRYLEDLLSGSAHQPVRLFPYYRALLEIKGAERIHPADLFFPSLSIQEKIPELTVVASAKPVNYSSLRLQFEKLLLTVLTNKDGKQQLAAVQTMHDLIKEIEQAQSTSQAKAFWLVMRGFSEAVAQGLIENKQYVKQIFGRINLQIRRLVEGLSNIPERLLRDALFFIAQVDHPSPFVAQIRKAYQLDNQVPLDYDQKNYGQIAANVMATAKEQLSSVKNLWGRIANGDSSLSDKFAQKLKDLADSGTHLNSPPLSKLLRELSGIARHAAHSTDGSRMGLELATCLLFVENALDQITHLPAHFSERADEITARLLSLVAGEEPSSQAAWMGEISREAQQRQTMSVLVAEMQASLRQVEKTLDEYFRDPASKEILTPVDAILHQIGGALAILDQDDAMLAVEHTRAMVGQFVDVTEVNDDHSQAAVYQNVAENVGALSFFIETLQNQPELAKKKFVFDSEAGLFRSNLLEKTLEKELLPSIQMTSAAPQITVVTAEQELADQQKESARLAVSLAEEPDNSELQAQLKDSLESERSVANLLDDADASTRARAAINLLDQSDFSTSSDALSDIVAATTQVSNVPELGRVPDLPASDEAIDAELLEIFLTEADEVLGFVRETIPSSKVDPSNQEYLTSLRRSFHTLKGSGRMVGLMVFGEAAWSIEQVMNLWLSDSRDGTEQLYALLDKVATELFLWVDDLKSTGQSQRNGSGIIAAAERIKNGQDFALVEELTANVAPAVPESIVSVGSETNVDVNVDSEPAIQFAQIDQSSEEIVATLPVEDAIEDMLDDERKIEVSELIEVDLTHPVDGISENAVTKLDADVADASADSLTLSIVQPEFLGELDEHSFALETLPESGKSVDQGEAAIVPEFEFKSEPEPDVATATIIDFPDFSIPAPTQDENVKRIGDIEISLPLHTIYMAETDEIVRFLAQDFAEWRHEPSRHVSRHAVHAAHSLAGSSATVGLVAAQELAHNLEVVLQRLERHPVVLETGEYDVLDHAVECAKHMLQKFALSEMADRDPAEGRSLDKLLQAIISRSNVGEEDGEFITSTNEKLELADLASSHEIDEEIAHEVVLGENFPEEDHHVEAVQDRLIHEVSSTELELSDVAISAPSLPADFQPDALQTAELQSDEASVLFSEDVLAHENGVAVATLEVQEPESIVELADSISAEKASTADYDVMTNSATPELRVNDELDEDLLPVFIEEGNDLLPMVGQLLRSWQQQPNDSAIPQSILRLMHTIKGSARMAGAMQLGQHTHDMETRIENLMHAGSAVRQPMLDDLLARHDYSMHLFDRLQNPLAAPADMPLPELTTAQELDQFQVVNADAAQESLTATDTEISVSSSLQLQSNTGQKPLAARTAATLALATPVPLVRVRADILDRLVNQAGEVSISRSKLENEVDTLRSSLVELTENVNRLRDQLREVEIQAETQITSRMTHSGDREFDPLEFDRFTRLQELTRMMAESVSDVASVQQNLHRTIDGATSDLHTQARLTRELQQDLMRVRMIPFASVSERLYRVTRQTSKEMDKRVNLDIRGTSVEIDRSVLEKMVAPFEHLLRNAIVHGIESRDKRREQGKEEIGELLIEIRQEGNEVVIHFTDDGQGLNLGRIREKAKNVGLLGYDDSTSDAEVVNMIFEPGFSTASEVTELAGRGVGMDVVRSEAASLGGRVSVHSVEGKGAHFTINLPLTLAVTQVVILTAGGKTFAVPSVLVEQVQQLKSAMLANAYNDGAIMWQGNRVPMYYLPTMLGEHDAVPMAQQYSPLLIMKSGSERVAIHVDDVIGNREVVVKNIGPQLARMTGIAGATVLGSGDIVLILNPVPLAQRMEHEHARNPHAQSTGVSQEMGAVAELATEKTPSAPVQGLRTQHTVMVVDDSLTVRRVTQRLLLREGYQVILAKDGIDALEQLQSITPDVMLVDIEMPRMDGFDLTRNIRGDARTSHIPIIMITSRTADKHRNYAAELGVNEYFGKPYREDDLLEAIGRFVGKEQVSN